MQATLELQSNVKKQCIFCSEVLCHSNTVIVNEEILEYLKFITKGMVSNKKFRLG